MKTFLKARWENIVMINYEVDARILYPYLPYGVELDSFENKVFISLVGFKFLKSSIFGIPMPLFGSFDEVNLRFYVKRIERNELKRGVVFISEIVPNKIVALLANILYKEHYSTAKMQSSIDIENDIKNIKYSWQLNKDAYSISASFENRGEIIENNSLEEFIYEHYYGYIKVSDKETWEYKVNHPRWQTNEVKRCLINCDFEKMYGKDFSFLNLQKPFSIYNAVGSAVNIDWSINKIKKRD